MHSAYMDVVKRWQEVPMEKNADIDQRLHNFRILFAYHSNKIENADISYHNTREIFENGKVIKYTGDLRTLFEIENQKKCYEFLKEKIIKKEKITSEFIKQIHKILMDGCYDESRYQKGERPGQFKKHDFVTGDGIGLPPEEVEKEIIFICNAVSVYDGEDILTAACYFHLNFESIHPFADDNGRVGRTLMNYFLMIHNYPPAIIYEEDKDVYYRALAAFDTTESLAGFIRFIEEQTIKTWKCKARKPSPLI